MVESLTFVAGGTTLVPGTAASVLPVIFSQTAGGLPNLPAAMPHGTDGISSPGTRFAAWTGAIPKAVTAHAVRLPWRRLDGLLVDRNFLGSPVEVTIRGPVSRIDEIIMAGARNLGALRNAPAAGSAHGAGVASAGSSVGSDGGGDDGGRFDDERVWRAGAAGRQNILRMIARYEASLPRTMVVSRI